MKFLDLEHEILGFTTKRRICNLLVCNFLDLEQFMKPKIRRAILSFCIFEIWVEMKAGFVFGLSIYCLLKNMGGNEKYGCK